MSPDTSWLFHTGAGIRRWGTQDSSLGPLFALSVCLADPSGCGSKPSFLVSAWPSLPTRDTSDACPCALESHNQGGERGTESEGWTEVARAEPTGGGGQMSFALTSFSTLGHQHRNNPLWKIPTACGPCTDSHSPVASTNRMRPDSHPTPRRRSYGCWDSGRCTFQGVGALVPGQREGCGRRGESPGQSSKSFETHLLQRGRLSGPPPSTGSDGSPSNARRLPPLSFLLLGTPSSVSQLRVAGRTPHLAGADLCPRRDLSRPAGTVSEGISRAPDSL